MKSRVPEPNPEYLRFLTPYETRVKELALAARRMVLEEAPAAAELIYDAYNAVAAGYSFTGRPGDAFIHIAAYAQWVNLGFNWGSELEDPTGMLKGTGRRVRHIRIAKLDDLKDERVRAFVKNAVAKAQRPAAEISGGSVVRAVYPKRRRPGR